MGMGGTNNLILFILESLNPDCIYNLMWLQGITEFNQREYYACHDTLEAIWMESVDPDKKFYQGVLQIAVACHHLQNHNFKGAAILLGEGMGRLRYYQPRYGGIDVSQLIQDSNTLLKALYGIVDQDGKPFQVDGIADFVDRVQADPTLLPVIRVLERSD
jgi:uncharacterized protein